MHSRRSVGTNKTQPNGIAVSKSIYDSEDVLTVSDRVTATAVKLASCEESTDKTAIATRFQSLSDDADGEVMKSNYIPYLYLIGTCRSFSKCLPKEALHTIVHGGCCSPRTIWSLRAREADFQAIIRGDLRLA